MNFISGVNIVFLFKNASRRDLGVISEPGRFLMLEEMTANHHVAKFMRVHALDEPINLYRQSRSDEDLRLLRPINRKVQQAFELSAFQHQAPYELYLVSHTASNLPLNARRTVYSLAGSNGLLNGLCPSWYHLRWDES